MVEGLVSPGALAPRLGRSGPDRTAPDRAKALTGQPITLRLESLDTRFHTDGEGRRQLAIDELGINLIAPPLGAAQATLLVSRPGTYRFYCGICCGGKANRAMWGRLIVAS